jgi:hypothetical protein
MGVQTSVKAQKTRIYLFGPLFFRQIGARVKKWIPIKKWADFAQLLVPPPNLRPSYNPVRHV